MTPIDPTRMTSEAAVELALSELPAGWTVLEDVPEPGRSAHKIDLLVVGPPGIFTVDAKMWTGPFEVRNGELTERGRDRSSKVDTALREAAAIRSLLGPDTDFEAPVTGVVCFSTHEHLFGTVRGALVCSTPNVVDSLTGRPAVLAAHEISRAVAAISSGAQASPSAAGAPDTSPSALRRFVGLAMFGVAAYVLVRSGAVGDIVQSLTR